MNKSADTGIFAHNDSCGPKIGANIDNTYNPVLKSDTRCIESFTFYYLPFTTSWLKEKKCEPDSQLL